MHFALNDKIVHPYIMGKKNPDSKTKYHKLGRTTEMLVLIHLMISFEKLYYCG